MGNGTMLRDCEPLSDLLEEAPAAGAMEARLAEAMADGRAGGRPRVYLGPDMVLIARDPAPACEGDDPYTWEPSWGVFHEPLGADSGGLAACVEQILRRPVLEHWADRSVAGPFDVLVLGAEATPAD